MTLFALLHTLSNALISSMLRVQKYFLHVLFAPACNKSKTLFCTHFLNLSFITTYLCNNTFCTAFALMHRKCAEYTPPERGEYYLHNATFSREFCRFENP